MRGASWSDNACTGFDHQRSIPNQNTSIWYPFIPRVTSIVMASCWKRDTIQMRGMSWSVAWRSCPWKIPCPLGMWWTKIGSFLQDCPWICIWSEEKNYYIMLSIENDDNWKSKRGGVPPCVNFYGTLLLPAAWQVNSEQFSLAAPLALRITWSGELLLFSFCCWCIYKSPQFIISISGNCKLARNNFASAPKVYFEIGIWFETSFQGHTTLGTLMEKFPISSSLYILYQ